MAEAPEKLRIPLCCALAQALLVRKRLQDIIPDAQSIDPNDKNRVSNVVILIGMAVRSVKAPMQNLRDGYAKGEVSSFCPRSTTATQRKLDHVVLELNGLIDGLAVLPQTAKSALKAKIEAAFLKFDIPHMDQEWACSAPGVPEDGLVKKILGFVDKGERPPVQLPSRCPWMSYKSRTEPEAKGNDGFPCAKLLREHPLARNNDIHKRGIGQIAEFTGVF